jgi:YggT family protein
MLKEIMTNFGVLFCDIMSTTIFIQILLSWFVAPGHRMYLVLESVTKPVMSVARKITPRTGMIDFSPIVAFIGLEILKSSWVYLIATI